MMQSFRLSLLLVVLMIWTCDLSMGATIRVERDGTGDYTNLHDAAANAQSGDTILIGPGRYTETIPFSLPGFTADTHMGIDVDNLTIRGVDRDAVIIGPTEPDFDSLSPKGILTQISVTSIRIESVTFENVREGIYSVGSCLIEDVAFVGCCKGIVAVTDEIDVTECTFFVSNTSYTGVLLTSASGSATIRDSEFIGASRGLGVSVNRADACSIRNTTFESLGVAVQFDQSTGLIQQCMFLENNRGVTNIGSWVEVVYCTFLGGWIHLGARSGGSTTGTLTSFLESTVRTVDLSNEAVCTVQQCDIVPMSGLAVETRDYFFSPVSLDLTNNYWGTEDADEIRAMIHDGNDDPSIHAFVDFEPFQLQSVPTATSSFGDFKARFGPDED